MRVMIPTMLNCQLISKASSAPHTPSPEWSNTNAGQTVAMRQQACALPSSTCQLLAALPKQEPPCCCLPAAMIQPPWLLRRCPYTTMSAKPLWQTLGEHLPSCILESPIIFSCSSVLCVKLLSLHSNLRQHKCSCELQLNMPTAM